MSQHVCVGTCASDFIEDTRLQSDLIIDRCFYYYFIVFLACSTEIMVYLVSQSNQSIRFANLEK